MLADLNEELARLGLAMENLGDIDRQTIAGAISTGTHGTGAELRNISAQVEAIELVLADGSVRELERRDRPRAAAGGAGRHRGARRDLRGDPALRPRLHARPGRHAAAARGGARLASRSAPTPTTTSSSSPSPTPTSPWSWSATAPRSRRARAAAPPPTSTTSCSRTGRWRRSRRPARRFPGRSPRSRGWPPGSPPGSQHDRSQRPGLRQRAPRPLHRDGVRGAARARARGGAPGDRVGARQPLPGLLPDRDAGRRRRRRPAQPLARARHRLHRRPPVPGDGVAPLLRGGRGDHGRLRRPPPLGQAPLPDRRDPGAALPALGRVPGAPATSSTPAASSPTSTPTASSAPTAADGPKPC